MTDIAGRFVSQVRQYDNLVMQQAQQVVDETPELHKHRRTVLSNPEIAEVIARWTRDDMRGLDVIKRLWLTWYKQCYCNLYETLYRITHQPMDCDA
jgi:hypothetical protein